MGKRWLQYTFHLFFIMGVGLWLAGCEGGSEDKNESFSQIKQVLTASLSALPQLRQNIDINTLLTINVPSASNNGDKALIKKLNQWLTLQCHLPNTTLTINYCTEDASLLSNNTFSPQTLQGLVATAFESVFEVYPNNKRYQTCKNSAFTSTLKGQAVFAPDVSRDLSLLDQDVWACIEKRKSKNDSQIYTLFAQATDQKVFAVTHVSLDAKTSTYQTNKLVDLYARKTLATDDKPTLIAWNIILAQEAQSDEHPDQSSRLILMLNTQTGNYIGKYGQKQREGQSGGLFTPSQDWVMLGRGGFDVVNHLFTPGQYGFRGRLINPDQETYYTRQYCIFNDATPTFGTTENCNMFEQELTEFFDQNDGFWDSQTMTQFLDFTSQDQSALALWGSFLDDSNWLELSDLPTRSQFPTAVTDDPSNQDKQ